MIRWTDKAMAAVLTAFVALAHGQPESAPAPPPVEQWFSDSTHGQLVATTALVLVIYLTQFLLVRQLATFEIRARDLRRRLIVSIRNTAFAIIVLGLVVIWATELRAVAVSLVAITAALVLATRELILCFSGGIYRIMMGECKVGDRIELNGMRGDVIDATLLFTTVLEIGPGQLTHQHTGRALVIPNSLLLTHPLFNDSFTNDFVAHTFQIPLDKQDDWESAEQIILAVANDEVAEFLEESRRHMQELETSKGLHAPSPEPRVIVLLPEPDKVLLVVRITVPPARRGRIEQSIIRKFLKQYRKPDTPKTPAQPEGA